MAAGMGDGGKGPGPGVDERFVRVKRSLWRRFWALLALGGVGVWLGIGGLNYGGFCISEGHVLSDEELIRKAVALELAGRGNVLGDNAIVDNSVDEFLDRNPNCCGVSHRENTDRSYDPVWFPLLLHDFRIKVSIHYRAFETGDTPFRQSYFCPR